MNIGLALSGGGIKGAAHIGVIQALQEVGINANMVAGTSIGSIVAALYAMEYTPKEMVKLFNYFSKLIFKNSAMYTDPKGKRTLSIQAGGIYSGESIAMAVSEAGKYKGIKKLTDLKMPIAIPAVDINDSKKYVFTNMEKIDDDQDQIQASEHPVEKTEESSIFTEKELHVISQSLGVPDDLDVEIRTGEPEYYEAGDLLL